MTKKTMIWQVLSMIIAGMVRRKEVPDTLSEFENQVVDRASALLDYPKDDILTVLRDYDCTGFAEEIAKLYE